MFTRTCIIDHFVPFIIFNFSVISHPSHGWCWISDNYCFEDGQFAYKEDGKKTAKYLYNHVTVIVEKPHACDQRHLWYYIVPSWIVRAMGLRVKSGVVMPSGSSSTYWVIITPGTLDLFLILTVIKWIHKIIHDLMCEELCWTLLISIYNFFVYLDLMYTTLHIKWSVLVMRSSIQHVKTTTVYKVSCGCRGNSGSNPCDVIRVSFPDFAQRPL